MVGSRYRCNLIIINLERRETNKYKIITTPKKEKQRPIQKHVFKANLITNS